MPAALSALAPRWNAFWFATGDARPLALLRILFAFALAEDVRNAHALCRYAIAGGFHWPYFGWWPLLTQAQYDAVHWAQLPLILLLGVGVAARSAALGLLLLQGLVFGADHLNFRNHGYLFLLVLAVLAVSPAGEALAVGRRKPERPVLLTAQRLLQVQVTLVYAWAAVHKLHPAYLRGEVLAEILHLKASFFVVVASWATVAGEVFLAVGLWTPRTRRVAVGLAVLMHTVFALTLDIYGFSLTMLGLCLLFLPPRGSAAPDPGQILGPTG